MPDIFICGHSHILRVKKDPNYKNMLVHQSRSRWQSGLSPHQNLMRFEIVGKEIKNLEVIELGKTRGYKSVIAPNGHKNKKPTELDPSASV